MRTARSWTASTYNQRLACIRSCFTYAAAAEPALAIYLAGLAAIPRLNGPAAAPVKYMTTDAVAALLAAPDPGTRTGLRDQFFMILMYDLAARDAEMLALDLAGIDTRRLTADLPGKGSKPRRLPITSETARHFARYTAVFHPSPEPATPMFYTVRNHSPARMSDDNVARFIRQHASTAKARCPDIPDRVHPHMLRHSRAMHLYQAGMPLALLTEWLGHADPETTLIYAHADTEMKRRALEKASSGTTESPLPAPVWHDREDIIQRLCGLKE
jgi:site-specific recombinase XerD